MTKDKQHLLPIEELASLAKLSHGADDNDAPHTVTINVSCFQKFKEGRDAKSASIKIREYLDCYKIFK